MQRLLQTIPICSFLGTTVALSLPPSISISQNMTALHAPSTNLTVPGSPYCSSYHYGHDLNLESCENAWEKISKSRVPQKYRKRPHGTAKPIKPLDMALPVRYLSDDGICAIDIISKRVHGRDPPTDVATALQISGYAGLILDKCVHGEQNKGGSITGVGMFCSLGPTMLYVEISSVHESYTGFR